MGAGATLTQGHWSDVLDELVRCVGTLRQEGAEQCVSMSFISQDKVLVQICVIYSLLCTYNGSNRYRRVSLSKEHITWGCNAHLFQHHLTPLRHNGFIATSQGQMLCINIVYHREGGKGKQKWRFRGVDVHLQIFFVCGWHICEPGVLQGRREGFVSLSVLEWTHRWTNE